jgi:hypothetical protein
MAQTDIVKELQHRLAVLERAARPSRGSLNLKQAAAHLNRSAEWLRREHLAGRGPKRRRRGARGWDYEISDLDYYREHSDDSA